MMDDFRALAVFVTVADEGGFTQAGRRLDLSTSVVSHHIKRLEEQLGTSLFYRSTRSMSLTPEGERMIDPARRMVAARNEAIDALAATSDQPAGHLRVTMPAFGEAQGLHAKVWSFVSAFPHVEVSLHLSDQQVDLIKEGFDVAIRLGQLSESSLKHRKIGLFERTLVAAPHYLEELPAVEVPDDLAHCRFLSFSFLPDGVTLTKGMNTVDFNPSSTRLQLNSVSAMRSAIKAGLGIQRLPTAEVQEDRNDGSLIEVLPDWSLPTTGIYAVWSDTGPQKKLTRRFIDHLADAPT